MNAHAWIFMLAVGATILGLSLAIALRTLRPRVRPIMVSELYEGLAATVFARSRSPTVEPARAIVARRALFAARAAGQGGDSATEAALINDAESLLRGADLDAIAELDQRAQDVFCTVSLLQSDDLDLDAPCRLC